ncbi:MAG: NAD(P) transhydrogenase subunit alpha [Glaciecola sp.]
MKLLVPNEGNSPIVELAEEKRVAATPESVKKFVQKGINILVESGAGHHIGCSDADYEAAGAVIVNDRTAAFGTADVIAFVNRPSTEELAHISANTIVLGHIDPFFNISLVQEMAIKQLSTLSIEMIPRSTRAQKMDALSSQSSLAGYVMVMQAATHLPSILPMMMTPSGTIKPAKVFVIGAGVAGLQAIATAKRLGASVLAYDTRPVVAEQVESLGGKFLHIDIGETGQTKDGYAKELTEEQKHIQIAAQQDAIADADIVITTAQLFGRKPPVLINQDTLALMRPGSVVVDMAASSGGNVEGSVAGETIIVNGVTVIGLGNWSQAVAKDASNMYANNVYNLIDEFYDAETNQFDLDLADEILAQSVITHGGEIRNDMLLNVVKGA